ncbi:MAG TPA: hypothetical protein VME45_01720 [Stellaceae bacterium]|nr:hypothetical protein [Stellaceae bacterium]
MTPAEATNTYLTESDVNTIMLQAVHEANARGKPATIVVIDRVGNVLAATQMPGAPTVATVTSNRGIPAGQGLEGASVPTQYEAIAKAFTAAYFSSNNNAFTTRTGNQIIQEHFNPGIPGDPSGPLFGVQFSQLECSDVSRVASAIPGTTSPGPHRSPLGFGADAGGIPLFKNGSIEVGAIGVMSSSTYSLNPSFLNQATDDDEVIAFAGQTGYAPPPAIEADNISVGGNTLDYIYATPADFAAPVSATGTFTPLVIPGYYAGPAPGHTAVAGTIFGAPDGSSGFVLDGTFGPPLYSGATSAVWVYTDGTKVRFPPTNGLNGNGVQPITAAEAAQLVVAGLNVAAQSRSAIRVPINTPAQLTVTVVDYDGNILATARGSDTLVDSADVTPQKARSSVFFSRTDAASKISSLTGSPTAPSSSPTGQFSYYINQAQTFFNNPNAFADGVAFSTTGLGTVARPFYPDGIDGSPAGTLNPSTVSPPGPLSLPYRMPLTSSGTPDWSLFNTGLQLDLVKQDILDGITTDASFAVPPPPQGCAGRNGNGLPPASGGKTQLANGLETFLGGFPIYRGNVLVGAISGSGDGGQQDDLIPYLALQPGYGGPSTLNAAPSAIRDDQLNPQGEGYLRYANCPTTPFLNSSSQAACD